MYSPSTYCASDTNVLRRLRRRVYLCSRRKSSIFWFMRSMKRMMAVEEVSVIEFVESGE